MKQKTLGEIAFMSSLIVNSTPHRCCKKESWLTLDMTKDTYRRYEFMARAVVREHEKRKGVCVWGRIKGCAQSACGFGISQAGIALAFKYCPKCGKRIKVGK